jgi:8-oxo-dGTP diphosphatase
MKRKNIKNLPSIIVAAAIIQQEEKFLLTKRKPASDMGGLWEFPGGKIEPGETLAGCLRRELMEELGVEINEPQLFHFLRHQYPEKEVELHFFTCSIVKGHPEALGCAEIAWVPQHELSFFRFPPADMPVLQRLVQLKNPKKPE